MGEKYGPDKNHKIVLTPIEKYFIAMDGQSKLVVPESLLTSSNIIPLIQKLNEFGFDLGSGHDGMELKKDKDGVYILRLTPYVGHSDQVVIFKEK